MYLYEEAPIVILRSPSKNNKNYIEFAHVISGHAYRTSEWKLTQSFMSLHPSVPVAQFYALLVSLVQALCFCPWRSVTPNTFPLTHLPLKSRSCSLAIGSSFQWTSSQK